MIHEIRFWYEPYSSTQTFRSDDDGGCIALGDDPHDIFAAPIYLER